MNDRWQNGKGYSAQLYFYRAINKYGWDNSTHEILFDDLTKQDATRLEQICIALFRSNDRQYGYNLSIGGENGSLGHKKTEEQKERLRQANLGKKLSKEHKEKIRQSHLGKPLNLSLEEREWRSKLFSVYNPTMRFVYCLETNKIYFSGCSAAKQLGLNCEWSNVTRCCRHEIKSVQGYHFCFVEELKNIDWEEVKTNHKKRRIYCEETNLTYTSAVEAARTVLGCEDNSGIVRNCQGKQSNCKGYHFKYAV